MGNAVRVSVIYIVVAVSMTVWLASTLYRNGLELLRQRDDQQPLLAQATSRLLVIGFALFTLGYAFLLLRVEGEMTGIDALQFLVQRLGILLVSLGLIHLLNTLIFLRFRRSRVEEEEVDRASRRASSSRRRSPPNPPDAEAPPSEQARQRRGE